MTMLTGASILKRGIIQNLRSVTEQVQPCGVDLTLRRVLRWTSTATIDFDKASRRAAATRELHFSDNAHPKPKPKPSANDSDSGTGEPRAYLKLGLGTYLVDFNERCRLPRDCAGQIFARPSLWRSGGTLSAGVVDAGYEGTLRALLEVRNKTGIVLRRDVKLGQFVVHVLDEEVQKGYRGGYQHVVDREERNRPPPGGLT